MRNQSWAFVLASSSVQRSFLLELMGIEAQVLPVDLEEDQSLGRSPAELVEILALQKLGLRLSLPDPGLVPQAFIMTADTIVSVDEQRLGKPESREQAGDFLRMLSGRTHEVFTALALYIPKNSLPDINLIKSDYKLIEAPELLPPLFASQGIVISALSCSSLRLVSLSEKEIQFYLDLNEYQGCSGRVPHSGSGGLFCAGNTWFL